MVKAKYSSTQQELYGITNLAINNLEFDLLKFKAKSTNYDAAFVSALRGLRTAAMGLPDEEQRNGVHQVLGGLLPDLLKPILQDFVDLQQYIKAGWPTEEPKPRYESAGLVNYNKIGASNWEYVEGLNTNMTAFISDPGNLAKITTPGGMIATYVADVAAHYAAFKLKYDAFVSSRETSTAQAAKMNADNLLFTECMKFMDFGVKSVFKGDEENIKRYTFTALKNIISPPGAASLSVYAKNSADVPWTVFEVEVKANGKPAMKLTAANAVAFFTTMDADKYSGKVVVNGATKTFEKDVNVGTDARVTVVID